MKKGASYQLKHSGKLSTDNNPAFSHQKCLLTPGSVLIRKSALISTGLLCMSTLTAQASENACLYSEPYHNKSPEENKKPNIIFIMVDDAGWTDLGVYGSDLHETPNLDKLAKTGMKFTDAYSASTVSTPTRAALITGKHPARLNMTIWREDSGPPDTNNRNKLLAPTTIRNLPLDEFSIAKALKDAGYYTAHIGKWHLGDAIHYPEAHGFDINIGGSPWGMPFTYWYPFQGWRAIDGEYRYVPGLERPGIDDTDAYLTDRLTDEALKVIEANKDQPFFLHLSYYTPHVPIEGKPEYEEYFKNRIKPGMIHRNPGYAAMIASLDENVGRVLSKIEETGNSDNTVVFFYSDNGGLATPRVNINNNLPLRSGKGSLYEGGIRVPLIVKWPDKITSGSICRFPVTTMDFYPTFLEIAGIEGNAEHNKNIDGLSLIPLLDDPETSLDRETLFWHFPHYYPGITSPASAMRKGEWKLLHYFEDNRIELYNLNTDLAEENNLANEYPDISNNLYEILREWRIEVNAQFPSFNPDYIPEAW